jgi:hypothetical protein
MDLNAFSKDEITNTSLKRYLDLNRYAVAIQYKLENEKTHSNELFKTIDIKNLSVLQKLIYKSPSLFIKKALNTRNLLRKSNINLRLFR